ncbi:carbon monoxide dehydrogenase subunit G [Bacillus sp. ISL-4]|uniref:CoxG family protein n=1 Tax=Bacillus sp. ISL-4 TaxID=2819125 RepID=UPI001BE87F91|nr:carbon monoxide dehydrogenase subunit G [Bacillus sp. ISL-4]MBT2669016.1 carbon monoxide dehydrogenase subunit G [Bacillus sp. ISL-4]MBT2671361.1 carbon monoxide dehydrogenase subunit G [Streptomyces sp. ISL-14]
MELKGKTEFKQPVDVIWNALHNPEVLKEVIPGCQKLELIGENEYEVVMKLGVAAVKGEYVGKVKLEDIEKDRYYVFNAEGSGSPGHVKAKMDCKLNPTEKGCVLDWDCNAEVGGMIASVGSRVLVGIAKFMAGKFFKDIEKKSGKKTVNN